MVKIHCSLSYHRAADDELDNFATGVRNGMKNNPTIFLTPPYTDTQWGNMILDYTNKREAYTRGGMDQKPAFIASKGVLMTALDKTAEYTDGIANGADTIIVAGGYVPTKASSTEVPPPGIPAINKAKRGEAHGEVFAETAPVPGATTYGCLCVEGTPLTSPQLIKGQLVLNPSDANSKIIYDLNKGRKKKFEALKPGTNYFLYYFASNANGVSGLSDPVSIMAT